jgi:hypothetical protein
MRPLARTGGRWSRRKYHRHSRANLKDTRLNSLIREAPGGNCCVRVLTPGATSGDFARQTWLRLSIEGEAAARYLAVARTGLAKPMAELRFDTFVAVLQAALDGWTGGDAGAAGDRAAGDQLSGRTSLARITTTQPKPSLLVTASA